MNYKDCFDALDIGTAGSGALIEAGVRVSSCSNLSDSRVPGSELCGSIQAPVLSIVKKNLEQVQQ